MLAGFPFLKYYSSIIPGVSRFTVFLLELALHWLPIFLINKKPMDKLGGFLVVGFWWWLFSSQMRTIYYPQFNGYKKLFVLSVVWCLL